MRTSSIVAAVVLAIAGTTAGPGSASARVNDEAPVARVSVSRLGTAVVTEASRLTHERYAAKAERIPG